MSQKICIVNYGLGNLGSIRNMYKKLGVSAYISESSAEIEQADKIILPGVGAFDEGMQGLKNSGFVEVLSRKVLEEKTPILGLCLGMQLLTEKSKEGAEKGLGWINAETKRFSFPAESGLKIPHMGWNEVKICRADALVGCLDQREEAARFYFLHSYYVECADRQDVLLQTGYGIEFDVAFRRENIMGVQFHPEKSHKFGMQILRNFYEL